MNKSLIALAVAMLIGGVFANETEAQLLKKLKNKVSDKIVEKVDKALDGDREETSTSNNEGRGKGGSFEQIGLAGAYNFTAGTDTVYFDDFSSEKVGDMASHWKSNSSGSIGTSELYPGNWLFLNAFTTYKLKNNTPLPDNFTIEFDIVTLSRDQARDLNSLSFGFAHNNSVSSYLGDAYTSGAINKTEIHYWNKEVNNASSDNKKSSSIDFPLEGYAIGKMHVALTVKGLHLQAYLDQHKILDTDVFAQTPETKYFYISTSTQLSNGARIGVGNFKIAGLNG